MAVAAEQLPKQEYAGSTATLIRWAGARVAEQTLTLERPNGAEELSRADYVSGLREMLNTDPEFSEQLDINDVREHQIINGEACDLEGNPLSQMIQRGYEASLELAEENEAYRALAVRDEGDKIFVDKANRLEVGEAEVAISMNPINQLEGEHQHIYKKLGYGNLIYIQWYARADENTIVAGSFSVDKSDEKAWREVAKNHGFDIPEDADPNEFIRHSKKIEAAPEQVEEFVKEIREDYYDEIGMNNKRHSVSEYIDQNKQLIDNFFDLYYPSLAEAAYTGKNNSIIQGFAQAVIDGKIDKLKSDVKQTLMRVASGAKIDNEAVNIIDSVLRYAVVEEIRKGLNNFVGRATRRESSTISWGMTWNSSSTIPANVRMTNQLLIQNLSNGVNAGRSYGGCPGETNMTEGNDGFSMEEQFSSQTAYDSNAIFSSRRGGGRSREKWNIKKDLCQVESCPTRPSKVRVGPCGVCMDRCQKIFDLGKDPTKMSSSAKKVTSKTTILKLPDLKPNKMTNGTSKAEVRFARV